MASLTQKATGLGGVPLLSLPPAGELEYRSQPSTPTSDFVDINLGDLADFPFSQDLPLASLDTGSLSQDTLPPDVGVDLGASPRQQSPEQDRAASRSAPLAAPRKMETFQEALESEERRRDEETFEVLSRALHGNPSPIVGPVASSSAATSSKGKEDHVFLKPGPPVRPKPSAVPSAAASSAGKNGGTSSGQNGSTSSGPIDKAKNGGTSKEPEKHLTLAQKDADYGTSPEGVRSDDRMPTAKEWQDMDDYGFLSFCKVKRMPLPRLDKATGVISKDSAVAMEKLRARYGDFIKRYNEHWEQYRELQGQVPPGVVAFVPESSASASSMSRPTTSDMSCQTDNWVEILESENGSSSSVFDGEDDRDLDGQDDAQGLDGGDTRGLDSDDAYILGQLGNKQASRDASMDHMSPEVDMLDVPSSENSSSVPGNGSAARVDLGTANHGTAGSYTSAGIDVQFKEASATLGVLHKVYSSKIQRKLRNRYEHYQAQQDSETSLVPFRGSLKRSAERELDRDMDVLEGDINDTLNLAQALEESANFDLGVVLKRRKLGWVQQGSFGFRSLQ
ncbi:hypothetical protein B0O80DRAFT_428556 [Mortierella sp. GBAus27b]|nr:hypothetical protein B0O80DRAFT_428556 [Mortierella sp. GBAus27b]